jgi:YceI-like domain
MAMSHRLRLVAFVGTVLSLPTAPAAETHRIDKERSTLTVHVYKSGLFSALADNHIIQAPIASGSLSDKEPLAVELVVRTSEMKVLDPDMAAAKRAEVQAGMVSEKVLDIAKYPEVTFSSTMVTAAGADKWTVVGRLTIRGETRTITVPVVRQGGTYSGSVEIKQRDFGIEPISVAGGTVKVKDQLKIEFDIVVRTN